MRSPDHAVRVAFLPLVLFALAPVFACRESDDGTSELTGPSDPLQVNLESITVDDPLYLVLERAIQDEYRAQATYDAAVDAYGEVRPFNRIVLAEGRHISALVHLFDKRHVPPPLWDEAAYPIPADFTAIEIADACALGVAAEIANKTMYEELIASGVPADVESVFQTLKNASELNHRPAFSRCM